MGVKERKQREKNELRKKILLAASEILVKEGFEKLSIRKIARKIEYSPTTIYLYFKDKSELVSNLVTEGFATYLDKIEQVSQDLPPNPIQALRMIIRVYVDVSLENPNHYKAIFFNDLVETGFKSNLLLEGSSNFPGLSHLSERIKVCVEQKDFPEMNVELAAQTVWISVHGLVSLIIVQKDMPNNRKDILINKTLDMIINGLNNFK